MKLSWFRFLSGLNKALLPKMYRRPDLEQLSGFDKAVIGWKMWVTYRRLDAESARQVTNADASARPAQTAQA
jgi:hypothetical protein